MRKTLAALLLLMAAALGANAEPQRIADGVYLERDRFAAGSQPDGNSVLLKGPEGWVLFDAGRHAAHTQALIDFTRGEGGLRAVVNSHWHLDHLGGNAMLRKAQPGLLVYASPAVDGALKGWLADYRRQLAAQIDKAPPDARAAMQVDLALLDEGQALAPDRHIAGAQTLTLAGRRLRAGVETAVSGGDVWLLDTASGTLMSGDLVTLPVPFMDTACTSGWSAALGRLEALPFERLVPGHGPVMEAADLRRYHAAFDGLLACAADAQRSVGDCADAWTGALDGLIAQADKPRVPAMLDYYFKAHLRAAESTRHRFCPLP